MVAPLRPVKQAPIIARTVPIGPGRKYGRLATLRRSLARGFCPPDARYMSAINILVIPGPPALFADGTRNRSAFAGSAKPIDSHHPWRSRYAPPWAFAFAILQTQSGSPAMKPQAPRNDDKIFNRVHQPC
jgi:hypothetical protein